MSERQFAPENQAESQRLFTHASSAGGPSHTQVNSQQARALVMYEQKSPFKGLKKGCNGDQPLNETSVEVLKLDGSDFTMSDRELTKSNQVTLRSEEIIGGVAANSTALPRRQQLN